MRISRCPGYFWGALAILVVFPGGFIAWTFVFLYTKVRRKKVPGLKWTYFTKKDRRDALMMIVNARKEVGCLKKIRRAQLGITKAKEVWMERGEWTGNPRFKARFGTLFDDFDERAFFGAVWMEMARKFLMAVFLGLLSPDASTAQIVCTLAVVGVSLMFTVLARPYAKHAKNIKYTIVNGSQSAMFAMMLVQRLAISADISALSSFLMNINMASIGYSSFFSVAGIGIAIATFIAEWQKVALHPPTLPSPPSPPPFRRPLSSDPR